MKHSFKITLILVLFFLISQIVGLIITNQYIDYTKTTPESMETGNITWQALPYNIERPPIDESLSFLYIISAIIIGTFLLLLLIKFSIFRLWKLWFFLSVLLCLWFALAAFFHETVALILALIFTITKIFKPHILIHNLTEIFIYGGLAAIFVPIMDLFAVSALLILISIYDIWAVWHSGHMVKLAKFQIKTKLFAGLFIPYSNKSFSAKKDLSKSRIKIIKVRNAVLGGGDIGFPLIFTGVIMKQTGIFKVIPITLITTIALLFLLARSKENKFYPAMPFLTMGCFIGYLFIFVFGLV